MNSYLILMANNDSCRIYNMDIEIEDMTGMI